MHRDWDGWHQILIQCILVETSQQFVNGVLKSTRVVCEKHELLLIKRLYQIEKVSHEIDYIPNALQIVLSNDSYNFTHSFLHSVHLEVYPLTTVLQNQVEDPYHQRRHTACLRKHAQIWTHWRSYCFEYLRGIEKSPVQQDQVWASHRELQLYTPWWSLWTMAETRSKVRSILQIGRYFLLRWLAGSILAQHDLEERSAMHLCLYAIISLLSYEP
jgi:hypothetical protein